MDDIAKLYREFEDAYVDFLTAEGEGVLVARRKQLHRARTRLLAHKDFTEHEYEAAVLLRKTPNMSKAAHLAELERRHRALEAEIVEARAHPSIDHLQIVELKRRKLLLKDEIARLQN